jgi:2-dehydro-3-deoxy-L-rhamnonate dehydrogenase (NAD+)
LNTYDFSGRVALVTGGAGGMAAKSIELFKAGGAKCASLDIRVGDDPDVLWLTGDVASSADADAAVAAVVKEFGRLDILVCAAAIPGGSFRTLEVTDEDWESVMRINATGVFYCNRAAVQVMVPAGYGRIVNVASVAGKEGNPMEIPYSASKAAVIALTKALAKDLAKTGVLLNSITPGPTATPFLYESSPEALDYIVSRVPMGRVAQPAEMAKMIAFLASEDVSFSTGGVFDVSGGRAVY